jgi:hypothetical protein
MITQLAPVVSVIRLKSFTPAGGPARQVNPNPPSVPAIAKCMVRPPLPEFQRARLRAKVAAVTCSEPWTELAAASAEVHAIDPNLNNVEAQLKDRGIYPPRPELGPDRWPRRGAVRMRRCDACGRTVPPNNLACHRLIRLCDDCRIEPDIDPDEAAEMADFARAPGAQLCTLVEGYVSRDATPQSARQQLQQLGLTDPQITAMALTQAGYSSRHVAQLCRWSRSHVRKLLNAATNTLRRSGLEVPKTSNPGTNLRSRSVDAMKLDGMTMNVSDDIA